MEKKYYDNNGEKYFNYTSHLNMEKLYVPFLSMVPAGGLILDAGCGSGRDSKNFLTKGYKVEAFDISSKMVELATELTKLPVKELSFENLKEESRYDAIWASATLLHIPKNKLERVFNNISRALKDRGVLFASFKFGEFDGVRNERHFSDFTTDSFIEFNKNSPIFQIKKTWISNDVRSGREHEKWLNLLLIKPNNNFTQG